MGKFLKENWLWIALPMILAAGTLIFIVVYFEGNDVAPFIYNI